MRPAKTKFDYVFVSLFGRANWLATELAEMGKSVAVVDFSQKLPLWTPEDREGPFGFFRAERLRQRQLLRLVEDGPEEHVQNGFTVWLKSGPLEMKGPLSAFVLSQRGVPEVVQEYLLRYDSLSEADRLQLKIDIEKMGFERSWLAHIAHQLASNKRTENSSELGFERPLPLFSPYYFRRRHRSSLKLGFELMENRGVRLFHDFESAQFETGRKGFEKVSFVHEEGGKSAEQVSSANWVWMLSSEETKFLLPKVCEFLYPEGVLGAEWFWNRFRLRMDRGIPLSSLPEKVTVIEDLNLPWSRENLVCLEKTSREGDLDAWIRVPSVQRFRHHYIERMRDEICKNLQGRLGLRVECVHMPQDYLYSEEQIGPALHPVYQESKLRDFKRNNLREVYFDGPELWSGLDWHGQFNYQEHLLMQICNRMKPEKPAKKKIERREKEKVLD